MEKYKYLSDCDIARVNNGLLPNLEGFVFSSEFEANESKKNTGLVGKLFKITFQFEEVK